MRRIYYGSISFDVSDMVAQELSGLALVARESLHYRSEAAVGGGVMRPFAVGRTEATRLPAYVDGVEMDMYLVVGAGLPFAMAFLEGDRRPDPRGSEQCVEQLRAQIAEYLNEEE
ncbi:hypothetical protein [Microbacterium testaceum]|uniref:Uncharacterized protein n=1 Tax=Microbacterium testaceum TaxID=2033 RepID=A0A147F4X1_MICTE|nr:hypothetical protein [Microbacterium testaceum]KTS09057.1 hypothetical protein RSA3_14245 [Microbacterium testaceum]